jgi:hypothetical protein
MKHLFGSLLCISALTLRVRKFVLLYFKFHSSTLKHIYYQRFM